MLRPLADALREDETMGDWRDGLNSQAEVMGHLLSNELFANVTLIVGREKQRLRVVKEILQSLSRPFEHRLATTVGAGAGRGEERDEDGLSIFHFNDIEMEPMKQLLKFAYTHEWSWSGEVKDFSVVLSFLRLVQTLGVKNLARKIQNAVDAVMTTDNKDDQTGFVNVDTACQIFEDANSSKIMENLKNSALELILRSPSLVFAKVENYQMLTSQSFAEILNKDELAVESELQLFQIVVKWAKARCALLGQSESIENQKKNLKDIFPCIRFIQMTAPEFLTHVVPSQLLEVAETLTLHTYFCSTLAGIAPPTPASAPVGQQQARKYAKNGGTTRHNNLPPTNKNDTILFEEFGETEKNQMLSRIGQRSGQSNSEQILKLDIKLVADWRILMAFLEVTPSSSNSPKLNLKVDTIRSSSESPKSSIKFGQVTSLHFESLHQQTQLLCLINIVQNSPNLRQLSIGHFAYHLRSPQASHGNMSKFLRMVSLRNLEFSCGFLDNPELNKELFVQLKGNGVAVKKLGFNWNTNPQLSEIIDLIQGDLEEIHYLSHCKPNPTLQCHLDKLKILGIWCNFNILHGVLKKTPNVQKIFLRTESGSAVNEQISLPYLTSLSVFMWFKEDPEHVAKMFANCPNLSRLTCTNWNKEPMAPIYEKFRHIKKFRYLQQGGVTTENVVGMAESALTDQHLNHWIQNRPPYIGHFKELTSLSFGYKDYQHRSAVANWNLDMKVFTHGIGHLTKLNKLCLPPMVLESAKNILTSLTSSGMAQLQLVQLQVWAGKDAGYSGTMKSLDVEGLAAEHAHRFKVTVKPVRREPQDRYGLF